MKINEIIVEGKDGTIPPHAADAHTGTWRFRDVGGYDRVYHLNRIMMAAASHDGKTDAPVKMDQSSFAEKYNVAHPYTEAEHNMMKGALKTVDSDYEHTGTDHKSKEHDDTHKVSPVRVRAKK